MATTCKKYFVQDQPKLGNQYLEDSVLRDALKRVVPSHILSQIESDLIRFGDRVLHDISEYGKDSEANPPKLLQYDAWGRRIDDVQVSLGWKQLQRVSAEEGLISIAYERKYKEWSRVYQFAKVFLFFHTSRIFDCPLSMTDGAARLIELWGTEKQKKHFLSHLLSRNPDEFWTSGQWMTERTGGSDVSRSETEAKPLDNQGNYSITGFKFFTSASTSEMAILLARTVGVNGATIEGSRGLSAYLIEMRNQDGSLNGLTVHKMKNKLGTKAVPTAEIELKDTKAQLIGPVNKGVKVISTILNITRIHNAMGAVSFMRRGIAIARDYCHRRQVFGKTLSNQPLHLSTLADMEVEYRAALQFLLDTVVLQGRIECQVATKAEEDLFRFLTPLLKLYTAKQAIAVISECIESLGGTGYMEDSDMPRMLRDAQVLSIWEGTTNVLSLDVWRAMRSGGYEIFLKVIADRVVKSTLPSLRNAATEMSKALDAIKAYVAKCTETMDQQLMEATARQFSYALSRLYMASLLIEQAEWSKSTADVEVAIRWCTEKLATKLTFDTKYCELSKILALDIDPQSNNPRGTGEVDPNGKQRARL